MSEEIRWTKIVQTKNPILRAIGYVSGVISDFFLSIQLRWGDMYEMEFDEKPLKK